MINDITKSNHFSNYININRPFSSSKKQLFLFEIKQTSSNSKMPGTVTL